MTGSTEISFAFRDDPGYIQLSDVSLNDLTTANGSNLLSDWDFSQGVYKDNANSKTPVGWTFNNINGIGYNGSVRSSCVGVRSCWSDGSVQGYDELSQSVSTTKGNEYELSFYATEIGGPDLWSAFSTNGGAYSSGNAADILAYVEGIVGPYPGNGVKNSALPAAPELSTWAMMLVGFLGLAAAGCRKAQGALSA